MRRSVGGKWLREHINVREILAKLTGFLTKDRLTYKSKVEFGNMIRCQERSYIQGAGFFINWHNRIFAKPKLCSPARTGSRSRPSPEEGLEKLTKIWSRRVFVSLHKNFYKNIHGSIIPNRQKVETTQMSINDDRNIICAYNRILLHMKKNEVLLIHATTWVSLESSC